MTFRHAVQAVTTIVAQLSSAKRICRELESVGLNTAFQVLRQPSFKLPWQQGPLSPLFTGKLVAQTVGGLQSMPSMPRIGLQDVSNPAVQVISVRENALSKLAGSHKFAKRRIAASRFYISDDDLRIRAIQAAYLFRSRWYSTHESNWNAVETSIFTEAILHLDGCGT